jgi:hypothetical protein
VAWRGGGGGVGGRENDGKRRGRMYCVSGVSSVDEIGSWIGGEGGGVRSSKTNPKQIQKLSRWFLGLPKPTPAAAAYLRRRRGF